ncbi:MAG: hypothetical protein ACTHK0_12605 [Ginsengibacter sp.]
MDEVFYIAMPGCPRCGGHDPAQIFADEVRRINDHLAEKGRQLWIWGDRLLDGKTTGLGEWEASKNNTYRAVDMIPKDVVICDWHYERPDQTAVYFAMKGFKVMTCPWRNGETGAQQVNDMYRFRQNSTPEMKERFQGILQTIWSRNDIFLKEFYATDPTNNSYNRGQADCFKKVFSAMNVNK